MNQLSRQLIAECEPIIDISMMPRYDRAWEIFILKEGIAAYYCPDIRYHFFKVLLHEGLRNVAQPENADLTILRLYIN